MGDVTLALSLDQPFATGAITGKKRDETRGHAPAGDMRPPGAPVLPGCAVNKGDRVAIVATGNPPTITPRGGPGPEVERRLGVGRYRWRPHYREAGWIDLPLGPGLILGHVGIVDVVPILAGTERETVDDRLVPGDSFSAIFVDLDPWTVTYETFTRSRADRIEGFRYRYSATEASLGTYEPGRFGWVLSGPVALPEPVPCPGCRDDGGHQHQGVWRLPAGVLTED